MAEVTGGKQQIVMAITAVAGATAQDFGCRSLPRAMAQEGNTP
jgi:hypothetical protein